MNLFNLNKLLGTKYKNKLILVLISYFLLSTLNFNYNIFFFIGFLIYFLVYLHVLENKFIKHKKNLIKFIQFIVVFLLFFTSLSLNIYDIKNLIFMLIILTIPFVFLTINKKLFFIFVLFIIFNGSFSLMESSTKDFFDIVNYTSSYISNQKQILISNFNLTEHQANIVFVLIVFFLIVLVMKFIKYLLKWIILILIVWFLYKYLNFQVFFTH